MVDIVRVKRRCVCLASVVRLYYGENGFLAKEACCSGACICLVIDFYLDLHPEAEPNLAWAKTKA
jgi:hypothetical protein